MLVTIAKPKESRPFRFRKALIRQIFLPQIVNVSE